MVKAELLTLAKTGNVVFPKPSPGSKTDEGDQAPQPAFNSLTLDQFRAVRDQLLQTEFQLLELEARFQAKQAELQQAKTRAVESDSSPASNEGVDRQLRERMVEKFKRDPEVSSLIHQMRSTTEELDHTKGEVKIGHDPARVADERRLAKLKKVYNDLWGSKSEQIRQRLLVPTSAPGGA